MPPSFTRIQGKAIRTYVEHLHSAELVLGHVDFLRTRMPECAVCGFTAHCFDSPDHRTILIENCYIMTMVYPPTSPPPS